MIYRVYDADGKGKVTFKDILEVLRNLTGSFMTEEQKKVIISKCMFFFALIFCSVVFICGIIWFISYYPNLFLKYGVSYCCKFVIIF